MPRHYLLVAVSEESRSEEVKKSELAGAGAPQAAVPRRCRYSSGSVGKMEQLESRLAMLLMVLYLHHVPIVNVQPPRRTAIEKRSASCLQWSWHTWACLSPVSVSSTLLSLSCQKRRAKMLARTFRPGWVSPLSPSSALSMLRTARFGSGPCVNANASGLRRLLTQAAAPSRDQTVLVAVPLQLTERALPVRFGAVREVVEQEDGRRDGGITTRAHLLLRNQSGDSQWRLARR